MKKLAGLVAVGCLLSAVSAQWLETTISLPDSMSGIAAPCAAAYDPVTNTVYTGGLHVAAIAAIDGTSNEKVARVPLYRYWDWTRDFCLDSTRNKIYCMSLSQSVAVIDGYTNSVLSYIGTGWLPGSLCHNSVNDRIYCAAGYGVIVIDCAGDTVTRWITTSSRVAGISVAMPLATACTPPTR